MDLTRFFGDWTFFRSGQRSCARLARHMSARHRSSLGAYWSTPSTTRLCYSGQRLWIRPIRPAKPAIGSSHWMIDPCLAALPLGLEMYSGVSL